MENGRNPKLKGSCITDDYDDNNNMSYSDIIPFLVYGFYFIYFHSNSIYITQKKQLLLFTFVQVFFYREKHHK